MAERLRGPHSEGNVSIMDADAVAASMDLQARCLVSDEAEPILYAAKDIVDGWVLVPRAHLRTIQNWDGDIDEIDAIMMCAEILADARLIGLKGETAHDST